MDCRRLETREAISSLDKCSVVWIVAEQDMGGDEFLANLLNATGEDGKVVYRLDLQSFIGISDDLDSLQGIIIGGNINSFCEQLEAEDAYLLLDEVNVVGTADEKRNLVLGVETITRIFLDYCKNLKIVVRSSVGFSAPGVKPVVLQALDEPETKIYIELHPYAESVGPSEVRSGAVYAYTAGLPGRIDNLLNELRFSSFDSIALGSSDESIDEQATIPASLRQEIERLKCGSDYDQNIYNLLVALTFFKNGENVSTIKYFGDCRRLRPGMASHLVNVGLAELAETNELNSAQADNDKFVAVKPAVQRFIHRALGEERLVKGFEEAATVYFGKGWKIGQPLKIHRSFGFSVYRLSSIVEQNATLILARLISDALASEEEELKPKKVVDRIKIFHDYLQRLAESGKYLFVVRLCRALLPKLSEYDEHHFVKNIRLQFSRALRMLGEYEEAIEECERLLKEENPSEIRASLYINMAYAYENLENVSRAKELADTVRKIKRAGSSRFHAESILIGLSDDEHKYKRLVELADKARGKGAKLASNTIRLDIIAEINDTRVQLDEYYKLAEQAAKDGDHFNMMRARIWWFELAIKLGVDINPKKIEDLLDAYIYSCSQRQRQMFMQSHAALWELLERAEQVEGLLKLFRHSSTLQRLTGKVKTELNYLKRLCQYINSKGFEGVFQDTRMPALRYFATRAITHNLLSKEQMALVHASA
ncbi:hypothetical protein AAZU54_03755 [Pseudomonas sp. Je.1.5.c]|uniref:hypothetical protein n=1 Tax=Pseudomonas sp. Je.1.5.c TaxID=3142839 RepID=UPI003DA8A68B